MSDTLKISVIYEYGVHEKVLFSTSLPYNEEIGFPFDKVTSVLKLLFPKSNVIQYKYYSTNGKENGKD